MAHEDIFLGLLRISRLTLGHLFFVCNEDVLLIIVDEMEGFHERKT